MASSDEDLWGRAGTDGDDSDATGDTAAEDDSSDDSWGFFGDALDTLGDAVDSAAEAAKKALENMAEADPDKEAPANTTDPVADDPGFFENPIAAIGEFIDDATGGAAGALVDRIAEADPDKDAPTNTTDPVADDPGFFENPIAAIGEFIDDATEDAAALVDRIAKADPDEDGLTNAEELRRGTNPSNPDTDWDGLPDGREVEIGTSPRSSDSDGDGLPDALEIKIGTNPRNWDTDFDHLSDYDETHDDRFSPTERDTDGDGIPDGSEPPERKGPWSPDSIPDSSIPDGIPTDVHHMANPLSWSQDRDHDGLTDVAEARLGTDPDNRDTDGDKIPDLLEVRLGTDPLVPDPLRPESADLKLPTEEWESKSDEEQAYLEGRRKVLDIVNDSLKPEPVAQSAEAVEVPVVAEPPPEVVVEDPVVAVNEAPADVFDLIEDLKGDLNADFDDLDAD